MVVKIVLQAILSVVFLYFFGWPAVAKFLAGKVLVTKSRTETGPILAPAVTVCGGQQKTKAWREAGGLDKALDGCNASHAVFNCVESKAWSLDEVVLGAQKGSKTKESLMNTDFWTASFYKNFACFTFASKLAIGTNDLEDELTFFLNKSLICKFYVHSSSYFIQNLFPAFPFNRFKALPMKDCSSYARLTLTKQVELDTDGDPCQGVRSNLVFDYY